MEYLIFTDGACSGNPGPGGWGAIIREPSGMVTEIGGGSPRTTNNAMELTAVIEALRSLVGKSGGITVRTDSTYVINGIEKWVHRWRGNGWKTAEGNLVLNQSLWEQLYGLVTSRRTQGGIRWEYVRGHQGTPGNERADWIATRYAQGLSPTLYRGPVDKYSVDLDRVVVGAVPGRSGSSSKSKAGYYLSYVGGKALRHQTWSSCESRFKGASGAKYKKVATVSDERQVLQAWGVKSLEVNDADS